jgi:hypothetical protein
MSNRLATAAMAALLATATSGFAMAQTCPAGYGFYGGVCQPMAAPGGYAPSNPVSGAVSGEAAGAAAGNAAAGPVGAVVGGALGLATGTVAGTANAVAGAPVYPAYGSSYPPPGSGCAPGYMLYNGGCYPAR